MPISESDLVATPATIGSGKMTDSDIVNETMDVVASLKEDFKERDAQYEVIEKVVYLQNEVYIPKGYQKSAIEVRSPYPFHILHAIVAALSVNPPRVGFTAIGMGEGAEINAMLRRNFFEASWQRQEKEAQRPLFRLFTHSVAMKGEGILKTVERTKKAWGDYSKYQKDLKKALDDDDYLDNDSKDRIYDAKTEEWKRGKAYPIHTTDVLPETFYYYKGEDGFTICAEEKEVPYFTELEKYGAALDKNAQVCPAAMGLPRNQWAQAMGKKKMLRMVEVWDWNTCTYILCGPGDKKAGNGRRGSGHVVKRIKHRYGNKDTRTLRGPYFHAFGITTSSRDVRFQGLSVLYAYLYLFPLLDSLLTIQSQAAATYGFPAFKRTTPPNMGVTADTMFGADASEQSTDTVEIRPGHVYPYDIAAVDMPKGGIDLDKAIGSIRGMLEMLLPAAAQGQVGSDTSGYAINQAAHLSSLNWDPVIGNIETAMSERTSFESELIERGIKETVYAYGPIEDIRHSPIRAKLKEGWVGIGPKDLGGVHAYNVTLDPQTPQNAIIELRKHETMLKLRLETPEEAIIAMGNDPVQVEKGWLLHDIKNDQAIKDVFKQRVFKALETMDQQALGTTSTPDAAPPAPQQALAAPPGAAAPNPGGSPPPAAVPAPTPGEGIPLAPPPGPGIPGTPSGVPGGERGVPGAAAPIPGM